MLLPVLAHSVPPHVCLASENTMAIRSQIYHRASNMDCYADLGIRESTRAAWYSKSTLIDSNLASFSGSPIIACRSHC